jgi:hypothetical protein
LARSAVIAICAMMTSNFPAWMPGSNPSQALSTNVTFTPSAWPMSRAMSTSKP